MKGRGDNILHKCEMRTLNNLGYEIIYLSEFAFQLEKFNLGVPSREVVWKPTQSSERVFQG